MNIVSEGAEQLQKVDAYWRAANYLSVGQIYLLDNPLLKRRLTYSRTNHHNIHVHGYKEEGTITTPYMTVLNNLDRFHLVANVISSLPQTSEKGKHLVQWLEGKLAEHRKYINRYGYDLPEIRDWAWTHTN